MLCSVYKDTSDTYGLPANYLMLAVVIFGSWSQRKMGSNPHSLAGRQSLPRPLSLFLPVGKTEVACVILVVLDCHHTLEVVPVKCSQDVLAIGNIFISLLYRNEGCPGPDCRRERPGNRMMGRRLCQLPWRL